MGRLLLTLMALFSMTTPACTATFPDAEQLRLMAARFAPTPLTVDASHLSAGDKKAWRNSLKQPVSSIRFL